MEKRKKVLESIVQNINFDYEKCITWIYNFDEKFGYITMSQYIRIIESKSFHRMAKDDLLMKAVSKMDFGCYENFFVPSKNITELYQKIFMLIMIEYLFDYISRMDKKISSYIVWEVIARYYIEEHMRLSPYDMEMNDSNSYSSKRKIFDFFLTKNIDLQDKINILTQRTNLFEGIIQYFYQVKNYSKMNSDL